jgi:spore coat protein CotH
VGETTEQDLHEFVELYNRGDVAVALGGWTLAGKKVRFTFPSGSRIEPRHYLVVAKSRKALLDVSGYRDLEPPLAAAEVIGEYEGELDNGSDHLTLADAAGRTVDAVTYRSKLPWPVGPDALGVNAKWLPDDMLPIEQHRFLGYSLERISPDAPTDEVATWDASELDWPSPGRQNFKFGTPRPVVESITATTATATSLVRKTDRVLISVRFTGPGTVSSPEVEYFVDDTEKTDLPRTSVPLVAQSDGSHRAELPPQPDNAVVRYRVRGARGGAVEVVSPRPSDPYRWYAYFVAPQVQSKSRVYHMFISAKNWTQLWDNISPGANTGCKMNDLWQSTVPATFVLDGKVWDVRVRYQGSRFQRTNGLVLPTWPAVGPTRPAPLRALSFKIEFPRYDRFAGGAGAIYLNKLAQGCPGLEAYVGTKLHAAAGGYGFDVDFARLHINGAYYHYAAQFEEPSDAFFKNRGEAVGDLFKVHGSTDEQAKYGRGDGSLLKANCNFTPEERYATVYTRKTNDWKEGQQEIKALYEGMWAAKAEGPASLRRYLAENFDVDGMLAYTAVRNWAGAWDDVIHNYYVYRRPNGKFLFIPWDLDVEFGMASFQPFGGGYYTATTSFYVGLEGNTENRLGPNFVKSVFMTAFRPEYDKLLRDLDKTILAPGNVHSLVDDYLASFGMDDWKQVPGRVSGTSTPSCDPITSAARIKQWALDRHAMVRLRLGD